MLQYRIRLLCTWRFLCSFRLLQLVQARNCPKQNIPRAGQAYPEQELSPLLGKAAQSAYDRLELALMSTARGASTLQKLSDIGFLRSPTDSDKWFASWFRALYWQLRQEHGDLDSCTLALQSTGQGIVVRQATLCSMESFHIVTSLSKISNSTDVATGNLTGTKLCAQGDFATCAALTVGVDWLRDVSPMTWTDLRTTTWYKAAVSPQRKGMLSEVNFVPFFEPSPMEAGVQSYAGGSAPIYVGAAGSIQRSEGGVVQCATNSIAISKYSHRLVGSQGRIFTYHLRTSQLTSASHSSIITFGMTPNVTGDEITDLVGGIILQRVPANASVAFINATFHFSTIVEWTRMQATVTAHAMYLPLQDWVMVYVTEFRCFDGMHSDEGPAGVFRPCTKCPAGYKAAKLLLGSNCTKCSTGTYGSSVGSSQCTQCDEGRYQDTEGATACKKCPKNTASFPGTANISACECMKGYYYVGLGADCVACPEGGKCDGKMSQPYSSAKYYAMSATGTGEYFRCLSGYDDNTCLGGSTAVKNKCKPGHTGTACVSCQEGYYRLGRACYECKVDENGTYAGFLHQLRLKFCLLIATFYLLRRVVNSRYKTLYIFLSFLQIFGLQSGFRLKWTTDITILMRYCQVANLQVDFLLPFCTEERRFPWKFFAYCCLPWFFLLVDIAVLALQGLIKSCWQHIPRNGQCEEDADLTRTSSRIIGTMLDVMQFPRDHLDKKQLAFDFAGMTLMNMRLMYLSICGRTFDMLVCTKVIDGTARLSKDPNIECWTGLHLKFMPLVVFSLVFYVVGTPVAYMIVLLRGKRREALYTHNHLGRWRLLYGRFRPKCFFWELVIILRRFSVVIIRTAFNIRLAKYQSSGYLGNFQAGLTCLVMFVGIAAHSFAKPFADTLFNLGESIYMTCIFLSSLLGMSFSAAQDEEEIRYLERAFFFNFYVTVGITVLFVYRDVELVHPFVGQLRRRFTTSAEKWCARHWHALQALTGPPVQSGFQCHVGTSMDSFVDEISNDVDAAASALSALRIQYLGMRKPDLKKEALAIVRSEAAVNAAYDEEDAREALIQLIFGHKVTLDSVEVGPMDNIQTVAEI